MLGPIIWSTPKCPSDYCPANAATQFVFVLSFPHPHAQNQDKWKEDALHVACRMLLWTQEQGCSPGPHTLKTQPVRTGKRLELIRKWCRVEYAHLFTVITMDVAQKPYAPPPCKWHVPRIPPSWGIYSHCPMEREGARIWGWERKADLHRKAMKAFVSSAQPGSILSHLSGLFTVWQSWNWLY